VFTTGQAIRAGIKVDNVSRPITDQGPVTAEDDDWMYFKPLFYQPPGSGTGANVDLQWQSCLADPELDVKAMRQLRENQDTLWLYAEAQSGVAASALTYDLSVLLILP